LGQKTLLPLSVQVERRSPVNPCTKTTLANMSYRRRLSSDVDLLCDSLVVLVAEFQTIAIRRRDLVAERLIGSMFVTSEHLHVQEAVLEL
jgi:hypothetical protein